MTDTLSVEAVNQMRIAMGLKPIPVPGDSGPEFQSESKSGDESEDKELTLDDRQALAGENYQKLLAEQKAKEERQKRKEALKKAREVAARNAVYDGKGIAEVEDDVDATDWLRGFKKRSKKVEDEEKAEAAKELARKRAQAEYTAKDLAGVRVGHKVSDLGEGEVVFTLKDREIGDGDSDEEVELENRDLRDKEALQKRLEAKKFKGIVYNPNDTDGSSSILKQYDDEVEDRFTLNGDGTTREQQQQSKADTEGQDIRKKGVIISLDSLLDNTPITDYKEAKEIKVKAKKSKSKKTSRKRGTLNEDDDIFPMGSMDIDIPAAAPRPKKRSADDANFNDDEDLQAELARTRRNALKSRKALKASDLAKQIKEEDAAAMDVTDTIEDGGEGLLIDATSEFVEGLDPAQRLAEEEAERRRKEAQSHTPGPEAWAEDEDAVMAESYGEAGEAEDAAERAQRGTSSAAPEMATTGIEEEESIGSGLAGTLKMLKDRRLVEANDSNSESYAARQKFLAEKSRREEEAEARARKQRESARGMFQGMSNKEREEWNRQQNTQRDQVESRRLAELFDREYKPTIELKYIDSEGRSLNQKEAFKELSHQFHGKGSGKQKQEKRIKKIEEEKKRMASSMLDASQLAGGMGDKKKNKQAGVRLQ